MSQASDIPMQLRFQLILRVTAAAWGLAPVAVRRRRVCRSRVIAYAY